MAMTSSYEVSACLDAKDWLMLDVRVRLATYIPEFQLKIYCCHFPGDPFGSSNFWSSLRRHFSHFSVFPTAMTSETLKISDGTIMEITRVPDIDDETWGEVRGPTRWTMIELCVLDGWYWLVPKIKHYPTNSNNTIQQYTIGLEMC